MGAIDFCSGVYRETPVRINGGKRKRRKERKVKPGAPASGRTLL
jgi:hypothetical protein